MATKTYKFNQNSSTWKNETGTPVNPTSTLGLQLRLKRLQEKNEVQFTNEEVQQFEQQNKNVRGTETVRGTEAESFEKTDSEPILANKKELLAQSSYLTRLNSNGCRETSRNKTAFIISITFNSDSFPKIKKGGVFQIIPNSEYKKVISVLDNDAFFGSMNTDNIDNVFRFFNAQTKELVCVGYARYRNNNDENALQAKPTKLIIRKKCRKNADADANVGLDVDTIFQHFVHDWAASFDINDLEINQGGPSEPPKMIVVAKNDSQLYASQKKCGTIGEAKPWSTYREGKMAPPKFQKEYSFMGSALDYADIVPAYIGPQLFLESTLKEFDIIGKSFRSSPFENSKLFKIYYSKDLPTKLLLVCF